jgi:hypothetical protein
MGQYTGAMLAVDLKDVLDCFQHTDGRLIGIMIDNASSNCIITRELQSTFAASGIRWPSLWIYEPLRNAPRPRTLDAFKPHLPWFT